MSTNNQMPQNASQLHQQQRTEPGFDPLISINQVSHTIHPSHQQGANIIPQTQQGQSEMRPSPSTSGIGSQSGIEADPGHVIDVDAEQDPRKSWIRRDPHQWTVNNITIKVIQWLFSCKIHYCCSIEF